MITAGVLFLFLSNPPDSAVNLESTSWSRHYRGLDRRPIKRDPYLESDSVLFCLVNMTVPPLSRSWSKAHKRDPHLESDPQLFYLVNIPIPPLSRSWSKAYKSNSLFRESEVIEREREINGTSIFPWALLAMSPSAELLRTRDRLCCRTLYAFPLAIFHKLASQFASHVGGKFSALASDFLYCIFFSLFPLPLFLIFGCFLFYFTPCFVSVFFSFLYGRKS
jgi:hypothetical protein